MTYKSQGKYDGLTGISLLFEGGLDSPLFETEYANQHPYDHPPATITIDTSRTIRYVSMRMYAVTKYGGIRLFDDQMDYIVDETWFSAGSGAYWT